MLYQHKSTSPDCGFTFYSYVGTEQTRVSEGDVILRHPTYGSYMGGNTLESMQQWRPSNLTVDTTILPEDIRRTVDLCCSLYHVLVFFTCM